VTFVIFCANDFRLPVNHPLRCEQQTQGGIEGGRPGDEAIPFPESVIREEIIHYASCGLNDRKGAETVPGVNVLFDIYDKASAGNITER
jgi:hypothetical protein